MWYLSTLASFSGSANRLACWSSDRRSKAASVGMKMVKGPGPLRVSTSPATDSSPLTYLLYARSARAVSKMFAMECFSFFLSNYICESAAIGLSPGNRSHRPGHGPAPTAPVYCKAPDHVITHGAAAALLYSTRVP